MEDVKDEDMSSDEKPLLASYDEQKCLLQNDHENDVESESRKDQLKEAALFSVDAMETYETSDLPQFGLLGVTPDTTQTSET